MLSRAFFLVDGVIIISRIASVGSIATYLRICFSLDPHVQVRSSTSHLLRRRFDGSIFDSGDVGSLDHRNQSRYVHRNCVYVGGF